TRPGRAGPANGRPACAPRPGRGRRTAPGPCAARACRGPGEPPRGRASHGRVGRGSGGGAPPARLRPRQVAKAPGPQAASLASSGGDGRYGLHVSIARRCSRTACARGAVATLTYVYADQTAVLGPLALH